MDNGSLLAFSVMSFLFALIVFQEWDKWTNYPLFFFLSSLATGGIFLGMWLHG